MSLVGPPFCYRNRTFARAVKNDPNIKGINVGQKEIKITQYADDTTVLVRDCDSVPRLLKLLEEFKKVSGLQINTSKTEAMWLGTWKSRKEKPFGFKWPRDPVLALGVHFSYDSERAKKLNLEDKIATLEKTLNNWKRRKLTLIGKIHCENIRLVQTYLQRFCIGNVETYCRKN